jgi:hypothetical protein
MMRERLSFNHEDLSNVSSGLGFKPVIGPWRQKTVNPCPLKINEPKIVIDA